MTFVVTGVPTLPRGCGLLPTERARVRMASMSLTAARRAPKSK